MRRPAVLVTVVALAAAVVTAVLAPAAGAAGYSPSSYASRLLGLVNAARENHGLSPLTLAGGTSTVAAGWTDHLAGARTLSHNPDLQSELVHHGSAHWTIYGENVGEGRAGDPDGLFRAYMQSPEHRANILEPRYRYVGVAVVFTGGTSWNTFDFVDSYGTKTITPTHHATAARASSHRIRRHVVRRAAPAHRAPVAVAHRSARHRHTLRRAARATHRSRVHAQPRRPVARSHDFRIVQPRPATVAVSTAAAPLVRAVAAPVTGGAGHRVRAGAVAAELVQAGFGGLLLARRRRA